jgi:hypothetical protein
MANWQQEEIASTEWEVQRRAAVNRPFGMLVQSVSSETEEGNFSFYGTSGRPVAVSHPFSSAGSWIRAIPEEGSVVLATYRADEARPHFVSYYQRNAKERISGYKGGTGLYRPLLPGEIEVSSAGWSQAYYSRRAKYNTYAGLVARNADQDKLAAVDRAPIHHRQLFRYKAGELGDEYRLGIVQRPKSTWETFYPRQEGDEADPERPYYAEEFLHVKNPAQEGPAILYTKQRGHVIDLEGLVINQTVTQQPLRSVEKYFATDDSSTDWEIDESGNVFIRTALAAAEGWELDIPSGNYKKTVELDEIVTIGQSRTIGIGQSSTMTVGDTYKANIGKTYQIINDAGSSTFLMVENGTMTMATGKGHVLALDDGTDTMFLIGAKGNQIHLDGRGSIKMASTGGNIVFLDDEKGAVTLISKDGTFITLKDTVTISDSSGKSTFSMKGDTIQFAAGAKVVVNASAVNLVSGTVTLGQNALLSSVLGEQLAILFDTHTHGTGTGPSTPPIPPNTAALVNASPATAFLSAKVKITANVP